MILGFELCFFLWMKSPNIASKFHPREVMTTVIKFAIMDETAHAVEKTHDCYYQFQGQLHVTKLPQDSQ